MKILKLKFKNINSLYGEWTCDFTLPEYSSNGIFAITGPTGAGKSSLLDAMCLAIYGRTPRLKFITKSSNEIMSRHTGECFAEAVFETPEGQFCCHWSQRRAYAKPDGNLLESKHEISNAVTGVVLETKKRDVSRLVEKITGMDFERFTRSMLLAQGGFAAFLNAPPDHRAPILEQITGTQIYSEISKLVHERKKTEQEKLDRLTAETSGIRLLSDDQETQLLKEIESKKNQEKKLSLRAHEIEKAVLWHNTIESLENELAEIKKESQSLTLELEAFKKHRKKLERAMKAADLETEHAGLEAARLQQKEETSALAESQASFLKKRKDLELKKNFLSQCTEKLDTAKDEYRKELGIIKQVRQMDVLIEEKSLALKQVRSEARETALAIAQEQQNLKKAAQDMDKAKKKLGSINRYLTANECDADLTAELAGLVEQANALEAAVSQYQKTEKQAKDADRKYEKTCMKLKACNTISQDLAKKLDQAEQKTARAEKELEKLLNGRLIREYRTEYEHLLSKRAFLLRIASLEEERLKLIDGDPCPLCGSRHHPFARGNIPETDQVDKKISDLSLLLKKAEQLELKIQNCRTKKLEADKAFSQAEKDNIHARHEKEQAQAMAENARTGHDNMALQIKKIENAFRQRMEPFGFREEQGLDRPSRIIEALKARQKKWQEYHERRLQIQEQINSLSTAIQGLEKSLHNLEKDMTKKNNRLESVKTELEKIKADRTALYGKNNPDIREKKLDNLVQAREKELAMARAAKDKAELETRTLSARIRGFEQSVSERAKKLDSLESSFIMQCRNLNFENESEFKTCLLSREEKTRLEQRAMALDTEQAKISARQKDRQQRLFEEKQKNITQTDCNELKNEIASLEKALKTINEQMGAIKQQLNDNTEAKKLLDQKKLLITAQQKEYEKWSALHELIGSADGKKYRNFAQGLTLEAMINHANIQLKKMTDRYILVRDTAVPLELNIIDNYQAGEIRSTKNLSGGETFIVSLALALGLSCMAGRNVRVDSLFLDEGFGTLDDEALETALNALSGLQRTGRLIGIISHVPALRDRISTRINIIPVSGGKSIIKGPGCTMKHRIRNH